MLRRCLEKVCRKHVAEIMGKMPDEGVPEEESKENTNNVKNLKEEETDSSEKSNPIKKEETSPIVDITSTIQLSNDPKIELKENIKSQEQKFEIQTNNKRKKKRNSTYFYISFLSSIRLPIPRLPPPF